MPTLELNLDMQDKEFRHFYLSAHIRELLAQQIRATREQRGWTQGELAEKSGMAQERISLLEDPDYSGVTLKTLRRLAEAFDVALIVRYAPFSELLRWVEALSPEQLALPGFENDAGLQPVPREITGLVTLVPKTLAITSQAARNEETMRWGNILRYSGTAARAEVFNGG